MNKKPHPDKDKIVELKQLVSQPECLKLLILHTPFTLVLNSLPICINLVKLDLSRNNLKAFPYLGEMTSLKFMFIHQNKLDIQGLISIFQENVGKNIRSPLSRAIVWVTYWGNKGEFNARHYLANNTSVLAVDNHMVVQQERCESISMNNKFVKPFDEITDVSSILQNTRKFNKTASEQQYMNEFWMDMIQIRKKEIQINPALRIQKVYRGWISRIKKQRNQIQNRNNMEILSNFFYEWRKYSKFSRKLTKIFKQKNKQYLLYPIKQKKAEQTKRKLLEFCQRCKKKVLTRKMNLQIEYKFFNILKSNQLALRSLYCSLNIQKSRFIMIHSDSIDLFSNHILKIVSFLNPNQQIKAQKNKIALLRYLYDAPKKRTEYLRLIQINQKSIVSFIGSRKQDEIQRKNITNYGLCKCSADLSKIYDGRINFSVSQKQRMNSLESAFEKKNQIGLSQLVKVSGNEQVLKDLVRSIYFFNMGYLTKGVVLQKKINFLSEYSIFAMSCILRLQKMWRSRSLQKKLKAVIKLNFTQQRAATIIQRWFRNLSSGHRRIFVITILKNLKTYVENSFYIKVQDYLRLVSTKQVTEQKIRMTFPEQNVLPFLNKANKKLMLSWDYECGSSSAIINHRIGKQFFTKQAINQIFDSNFSAPIKYGEQKNYQKFGINHLFHYQTQTAIFLKKNVKFMEIKCKSKYQVRMRVLGIKLRNYRFNHKGQVNIYTSDSLCLGQNQINAKKKIKNMCSIFISDEHSEFSFSKQHENYEYVSKFYISNQQHEKPIKFISNLKISMVIQQQKKQVKQSLKQINEQPKRLKSQSLRQNFDVNSFLITQANQIQLDQQIRKAKLNDEAANIMRYSKRRSYKNIKIEKKIKIKNIDKAISGHIDSKNKFNFILQNQVFQDRMTTQPDLRSQDRSVSSIRQIQDANRKLERKYSSEVRESIKKKVEKSNQKFKHLQTFTKNFINQGNFIQKQFLYGQIKRLKTQNERNSMDKAERIKTEQDESVKYRQRFIDEKMRKAQENHQRHKGDLFRNVIQRRIDIQNKVKKRELDQIAQKSAPKRMRINFAQECYPILGKRSINQKN